MLIQPSNVANGDAAVSTGGLRAPYPLNDTHANMWAGGEYELAEWCIDVPSAHAEPDRDWIRLLGVTEDIVCDRAALHAGDVC